MNCPPAIQTFDEGLIQEALPSAFIDLSQESIANISNLSVTIGDINNLAYKIT